MIDLFTNVIKRFQGLFFSGQLAKHITEIPLGLNRPYLVKGLLLPKQISILAAPPNTGKSCIVAALLAKLAQGQPFAGQKVKRAAVLYVGAEDPDGIAIRADGHFATNEDKASSEFLVLDRAIDMSNRNIAQKFIKDVKAYKRKVTANRLIIVFDTLTLSIGNSDENSAGDMTVVMANARELAQATGAHVMFVHHTSAADPKKARGSTALVGNPDTILVLKPVDKTRVLMEVVKQRSMPKGDDTGWEIVIVEYGVDDDGDLVTNPRADWIEDTSGWSVPVASNKGKTTYNAKANEVFRAICELEAQARKQGSSFVFATKDIADLVAAPFDRAGMKPESLQKAVRETLNALVTEGRVKRIGAQGYQCVRKDCGAKDGSTEYATLH
jgi:hypothetical protein